MPLYIKLNSRYSRKCHHSKSYEYEKYPIIFVFLHCRYRQRRRTALIRSEHLIHQNKRGFTNINSKEIVAINLDKLEKFNDGDVVTVTALREKGIINNSKDGVKILGNGELTKKLTVQVNAFSKSAAEKIEALGGKAEVI